jgi:hypothetical protein
MKFIKTRLMVITLLLLAVGCADLNVENLNDPESERALSDPSSLKATADGLYILWHNSTYNRGSSPVFMLASYGDALTASWGNFGMRDGGTEPRLFVDNSRGYPYESNVRGFFSTMYSASSSATDVVVGLKANPELFGSESKGYLAWAHLHQALTLSSLALVYDKAFIIDESTSQEYLLNPTFFPYSEVAAKAIEKFDLAIELSANNGFDLGSTLVPGENIDNTRLFEMANGYKARLLAYMPRNSAERASVDWAAVRTHAQQSVTNDFVVETIEGGAINQFQFHTYTAFPGWGRVDMRIINILDSSYPAKNVNGLDFPAPTPGPGKDARLLTNFEHLLSNAFRPDRGLYFFSSFRNIINNDYVINFFGTLVEIGAIEMNLLEAEAEANLGNFAGAAALINETRVANGGLEPVGANLAEVLSGIEHERVAEYPQQFFGLHYFALRRYDRLQFGTPLHFPVPAFILETLGESPPFYSFGGESNADGINTSNGGWDR